MTTHLPAASRQPSAAQVDVLLVTVTDVEVRAVLDLLQKAYARTIQRIHSTDKTYYNLGEIGGATVAMVQSEMGAGGLGAAQMTVQKGIADLNPTAVIMVGIAFGTDRTRQRIGDVLVTRQLLPYEPQRVGDTRRPRGDRSPASPRLLDRFRSGSLDWPPSDAPVTPPPPRVHFGLMLSGEKLIDNKEFRNQLLLFEPDAIGGEMEGAGLYVSAHDQKVDWIVVKAICDWADGNKAYRKEQHQRQAAGNAVEFVFHVLAQGGLGRLEQLTTNVAPAAGVQTPAITVAGSAPPIPKLIIGREDDIAKVKERLGIGTSAAAIHVLTAMRGWPGVGKTTLASALAYDSQIAQMFPDGVLWASLGQHPNIFAELTAWGRALGIRDINHVRTAEEAIARLAAVLRPQRRLLIVDDVWEAHHVEPFRVGGQHCALLITTRLPEVANQVAPTAGDVYTLGVLSPEKALELLQELAPQVVREHLVTCQELVKDLEGLPLAIQVAGRMLHSEQNIGFNVVTLLEEIRAGAKIIESQAPSDRSEVSRDTTPTVAALLQKSTDLLDSQALDCFAYLGALAPKPATFDATAMRSVWMLDDPKPIIRKLVNYGLLESIGNGRFWMHAILVSHARSFLTDD